MRDCFTVNLLGYAFCQKAQALPVLSPGFAAGKRGIEVPLRVPRVSGVPEREAALELATLAAADRHGVGAPRVEPAPLVRQIVDLAALRVRYLYVGSVVGADREQLAVVESAPRRLHTAD